MGRHVFAKKRRRPAMVLAAVGVPVALALAVGGDVQPLAAQKEPAPAVVETAPCCLQIVVADAAIAAPGDAVSVAFAAQASRASRWVVDTRSRFLPVGLAPERGLQVKTILIPNPGSAEGIALGNAIVEYVFKNAKRFGIQDAIWRGVYYTPSGPSGFGYGHYDHVHVTTTGGGYPTANEVYYR